MSGRPAPRRAGASNAPLLLAIESATSALSAALLRGEEVVAEARGRAGASAAESLLPTVDDLLRGVGVRVAELDAFAVSVGPGSFTSLRIGIATVKGLAYGGDQAVLAVPTLDALVLAAGAPPHPVVAVLDARRGEVYAAGPGVPEGVYTPEALAARLPADCTVVGEGVAVCGAVLRERCGPGVLLLAPPRGAPAARHVGVLGARLLARGGTLAAADLLPRYVRRAEAEVKRTGERFEEAPARSATDSIGSNATDK